MIRNRLIKACALRALSNAFIVASETYGFMLFLSAYPQKSIPYLYLMLAIFSFLGMQISQPFLKHNLAKFLRLSHILIIGIFLAFAFLIHQPLSWVPFIFSLFILSAAMIANTANWVAVTALFDLREFKAGSQWVSLASTLGAVLMGILIPVTLKFFPSIILLYFLVALYLMTFLIMRTLRFSPEKREETRSRKPPVILIRDSLFFNTFLCLVSIFILFILADFTLKSELGLNFDKAQIGQFLAFFFAIVSVLTAALQFFGMPLVLRRFGVTGLIMAGALAYLFAAGLLLIFSSFWAAVFLAGTAVILRNSFFAMGFQMLLNVYPPALRALAKYQADSYGRSLGMGLGALFLILFFSFMSLRSVALSIIIGCIFMIYITLRVAKHYFSSLKKAINLHRFDTDYLSSEKADEQLILKVASQALSSKNEDALLFGLSLFRRLKLKKVPDPVIQALSSEFETVKTSAIRVIRDSEDEKVVPFLMKQLAFEKNSEMIWYLVTAILHFSPDFLLSYALNGIHSEDPAIKAAAIAVFLRAGDEGQKKEAHTQLTAMVHHPDSHYRYWSAYVLRTAALPYFQEYIYKLIQDHDEEVVEKAFYAASLQPNDAIIRALIEKLSHKNLAHRAGNALLAIGHSVIPKLLKYIMTSKRGSSTSSAIVLLSKFNEKEAEEALLELLKKSNGETLQKTVINLAYRARQFPLSEKARNIIYEYALAEVQKIAFLMRYLALYLDPDVSDEINSRIFYAKKRYLHLLAAHSNPKIILQIIPTLLGTSGSRAYASAIELLELSIENQVLKESLPQVLEAQGSSEEMPLPPLAEFDPWLGRVVAFRHPVT